MNLLLLLSLHLYDHTVHCQLALRVAQSGAQQRLEGLGAPEVSQGVVSPDVRNHWDPLVLDALVDHVLASHVTHLLVLLVVRRLARLAFKRV
jgi:hypothetical protein